MYVHVKITPSFLAEVKRAAHPKEGLLISNLDPLPLLTQPTLLGDTMEV